MIIFQQNFLNMYCFSTKFVLFGQHLTSNVKNSSKTCFVNGTVNISFPTVSHYAYIKLIYHSVHTKSTFVNRKSDIKRRDSVNNRRYQHLENKVTSFICSFMCSQDLYFEILFKINLNFKHQYKI